MNKKLDSFFKISERGSSVKAEIIAGLTTFSAMAYILITTPNQLVGFMRGEVFDGIWNAVYIASILASVIGTLLYGLYAKLPYAQACSMSLSSFFFTSFIVPSLTDPVSGYQKGLFIIVLSGILFLILSVTGARKYIAKSLPEFLKRSMPAGIGLLIAVIGLESCGIISATQGTFVSLFDFHAAIKADGVTGALAVWRSVAPVVLAILGLLAIAVLEKKRVKGSILIAVGSVTLVYYVSTYTLPQFDFTRIGTAFFDFGRYGLLGAANGYTAFTGGLDAVITSIVLVVTFCLVDMFDTIGVLYATATQTNKFDENGDPISMDKAMICDSVATTSGALLGTSPCSTDIASCAGIAVGGKTGLTSVVTAICLLVCLFLTPLTAIIPACATAPVLVYVGVLMLKQFARIDMSDITIAVPAFLTLILIPLTFSVSTGIAFGAISYTVLTAVTGKFTKKDIAPACLAALFVLKLILV